MSDPPPPIHGRIGDFTPQARHYAAARPAYPDELVDELIGRVGIGRGEPIADIGAGTGIFTAMLAARGLRVTAVEPNETMRRMAGAMPGVAWREGTFESTGLTDASQRWVTAAQAFHWAEPAAALPELRRILSRDGCFTALWNDRDHAASAVLRRTRRLIRRHVPGHDELYRERDWAAVITSTDDFADVAYHERRHTVRMSRGRYLELWRSHNRLRMAAGARRFGVLLDEIGRMLDTERIGAVDVPYICRAWTARRT